MKEATLTSAHVADSFQSMIDWKAVRNNATILARKSLTILRNSYTPWVLTAMAGLSMWLGIALNDRGLYLSSAVAAVFPFMWGLLTELKNTNPDEL